MVPLQERTFPARAGTEQHPAHHCLSKPKPFALLTLLPDFQVDRTDFVFFPFFFSSFLFFWSVRASIRGGTEHRKAQVQRPAWA
jgi:hypothetical protein